MNERELFSKIDLMLTNLNTTVLRGKEDVIKLALAALLSHGHLLIEDVPGVGKTTLAYGMAKSINCLFKRIQFTSDMLPSDVIGVTIYNQSTHSFDFKPGPIFANVILADEINRTSPKTQSAFLEAMNDRQISVDKSTYTLPEPFMVFATQNPIEYEGTFPLPESQLDRFTMRIKIGYPGKEDEREIILADDRGNKSGRYRTVLSIEELTAIQASTAEVKVNDAIMNYMLSIIDSTRKSPDIQLGVSPRGAIYFYRALKSMALVEGRSYCIPDDVKNLAVPVLSHRIIPTSDFVNSTSTTPDLIIQDIVDSTPVPL